MAENKSNRDTIDDDPVVLISINGREKLISYFGPIPVKGSLISFEDGRSLKVLETLYKARANREAAIIINKIIIATRFV